LKKIILPLLTGSLILAACQKESFEVAEIPVPCEQQKINPAGRSYTTDSVVSFNCTSKYCGLLPLGKKNYWVYEDSIFENGVFQRTQIDTLRFTSNEKTLSDNLVWWKSNITVGLPETLYASDSAIFGLSDRMFIQNIKDVKKEFGLFAGDSLRYLTSFDDAAAIGRLLKLTSALKTPSGSYQDCLYLEKNARDYRRDQVYFKPGIGVLKYIQEKVPPGEYDIKLQKISTLIKYSIN
jgi:hypothetical protein